MKEKPILMSGPMVRAILEGRKTQTRRVCKDQPSIVFATATMNPRFPTGKFYCDEYDVPMFDKCPYGRAGDRLWVKETFAVQSALSLPLTTKQPIHYMADIQDRRSIEDYKVCPSIFMSQWASRITLEIVSVRVERLNEISEEDASAEGATPTLERLASTILGTKGTCRIGYVQIWESINGPGSWAKNPWVWVIGFRRVQA